jgi:hypothetical protein
MTNANEFRRQGERLADAAANAQVSNPDDAVTTTLLKAIYMEMRYGHDVIAMQATALQSFAQTLDRLARNIPG